MKKSPSAKAPTGRKTTAQGKEPPLAEQRRIVAKIEELFSELDAGEESLRRARRQLGVYRQSILKKAFTGQLVPQGPTDEPASALLDARRTGRVPPMFPTAKTLYKEARKRVEAELTAIQKAVNGDGSGADVPVFPAMRDDKGGLFGAITSPREGDGLCEKAFAEIRRELVDQGYETPGEMDAVKIIEFARIDERADLAEEIIENIEASLLSFRAVAQPCKRR